MKSNPPFTATQFYLGASASRYIRGESPVNHHPSPLLGPVKEEQAEHHRSASMHYGMGDSSTTFLESSADHNLLQDLDHAFDTPDSYAMAIRRPGSSGLLNLTVASEAELRRASGHHGVPEHELRSAGIYLTLTNNWFNLVCPWVSEELQLTSSRTSKKKAFCSLFDGFSTAVE